MKTCQSLTLLLLFFPCGDIFFFPLLNRSLWKWAGRITELLNTFSSRLVEKKTTTKNVNNLVPYLCQLRTVYSKMSCGILLVLTQANPDSAKSVKQNHFLSINLFLIHDNRQLRKVSWGSVLVLLHLRVYIYEPITAVWISQARLGKCFLRFGCLRPCDVTKNLLITLFVYFQFLLFLFKISLWLSIMQYI